MRVPSGNDIRYSEPCRYLNKCMTKYCITVEYFIITDEGSLVGK